MPPCAFSFARLGAVEQRAHDDGLRRDAAHFADEVRVRAFARARCAAEQDQLLREAQGFAAVIRFELLPDMVEDELGIFDLQIRRGTAGLGGFGGGWMTDGYGRLIGSTASCQIRGHPRGGSVSECSSPL
jgi:hypothetical protein